MPASRGPAETSQVLTELATKQLEKLKEIMPQATRIGVLWNPTTPSHGPALQAVKQAGQKLGVALDPEPIQTADDFDSAFTRMNRRAAVYIDKILKGANPADLPVEQAS